LTQFLTGRKQGQSLDALYWARFYGSIAKRSLQNSANINANCCTIAPTPDNAAEPAWWASPSHRYCRGPSDDGGQSAVA